MAACIICPRRCGADREKGEIGFCKAGSDILIARAAPHYWEEPCISGTNGSGTVFFGGCSLRCCYCQNAKISRGAGKPHTVPQLDGIVRSLEEKGVHNINLVTPTHYTKQIVSALELYTPGIPVVWNSGGYDTVQTLKMLEGKVQIYLPDFKYADSQTAEKYSDAKDYPKVALAAIEEMVRQIGPAVLDGDGIMQRGVLIRHLVLPSHAKESMAALKMLFDRFGNDVYYSIMNQYTPMKGVPFFELSRTVTDREYDSVVDFAEKLGIENGYTQSGESVSESFIPDFEI